MAAIAGAPGARAKPAGSSTKDAAARAGHVAAAIAWQVYATLLAGPTRLFVPDHTRDAAFQLWCDLRTNVPKDQKWATRRLAAFKPRTFLGWIAVGAFTGFVSAAVCAILCCSTLMLLGLVAVASYVAVGFAVVAGVAAAAAALFLAGCLFVAALVSGWLAACTLAGYCWLRIVIATCTFAYAGLRRLLPSQGENGDNDLEADAASKAASTPAGSAPLAPVTPQQPEAAATRSAKHASAGQAPTDTTNGSQPAAKKEAVAEPVDNKAFSGSSAARRNSVKGKGADGVQHDPSLPAHRDRVLQPVT